ncbi:hypothetical protein O5O45_11655 [Hahella aquimaris]|uniref:hypothetical protein n=1 Tax=Hahella sp. HNIBRBA332 TaxID=3015983 RepID=UPI00273CD340|nr:hypothetical protein [Hahella sp. HNIBRBA332]WLQ16576.1 hypothetical protein O5O45_11655 [Hahella sp. HNIBRBA332]
MKTTIETFKSQIVRKAIVFDIGGFRPPNDPLSSWFGKVTSGGKGEVWPSLIQSEIFWSPWNKHDAVPDYVFQIDTTRKGGWMW